MCWGKYPILIKCVCNSDTIIKNIWYLKKFTASIFIIFHSYQKFIIFFFFNTDYFHILMTYLCLDVSIYTFENALAMNECIIDIKFKIKIWLMMIWSFLIEIPVVIVAFRLLKVYENIFMLQVSMAKSHLYDLIYIFNRKKWR